MPCDHDPLRLVLLGAPGSGKGTQGKLLAARLGVRHVASGELLRAHVAAESELGVEITARLARGDFVPDDVVLAVVCEAVTVACQAGGYILDGFPRTRAQAERAYELALPLGIEAESAVYLALADDVARRRLAGRARAGRVDDADAEVIERRLQLFHANTRPILDFYEERGILVTVDASEEVGVVTQTILDSLASEQ
ncbi:MAG: adenylate kinase [Actinomycetota bacterium]|jgi:adenylate kinase|nr:adenylate kinase [Actinomycetota bacterium]